jgi:hypothetical protein
MKIRWTSNSVRFRITPSELACIQRGEVVSETMCIAGAPTWCAAIVSTDDATSLWFEAGTLRLALSKTDSERLLEPDREGVYFQTGDASPMRYFIEKDFPCAHPRAAGALEPETETFTPPSALKSARMCRWQSKVA